MDRLKALVSGANDALTEMDQKERLFHIFWLSGPFILLIERSPADIWMTVIGLTFAIRVFIKRDWAFFKIFWVRFVFMFWIACLISAAVSDRPLQSLGVAATWIRFPLYAMASAFWLGRDKRIVNAMYISSAAGLLIICCILSLEFLIEGQKGGRLTWPYGDLMPGNYIADVGMPAFIVCMALATSSHKKISFISGTFAIFTLVVSFLSGERMSFIIRCCTGALAAVAWQPKRERLIPLAFIGSIIILGLFLWHPSSYERYGAHFIEQLPLDSSSDYYKVMSAGVQAFQAAPGLGIGAGNVRYMCEPPINLSNTLTCPNHPHNFYIQIAGETGVIGLFLAIAFISSIIVTCFRGGRIKHMDVAAATAWLIPLMQFWPISSSHDFFGQWNNIFMWSAIGLALAVTHCEKNKSAKQIG